MSFNSERYNTRFVVISLILLATFLCLPGLFSIPVTDVDEARFAQATKQMVETHHFGEIKIQNKNRHLKPPGIYWLQSMSVLTTPPPYNKIYSYRLPSLLATIATIVLIFMAGSSLFTTEVAWYAAAIYSCFLTVSFESTFCSTDAVFNLSVFLMQSALMSIYLNPIDRDSRRQYILFWAAMAFGVFIKGISPLFSISSILALCVAKRNQAQWLRKLKFKKGIFLLIVATLAWLVPFSLLGHSNFLVDMIKGDLLPKIVGGQQGHGAPPGFYLLIVNLITWPMGLYLIPAIVSAVKNRKKPTTCFLLAWIIPNWIIFAIVHTKLPQYILPLMPPVAYLIALHVVKVKNQAAAISTTLKIATSVIWLSINTLILAALITATIKISSLNQVALATCIAAVTINAILALRWYLKKDISWSLCSNVITAVIFYSLVFNVILPTGPFWVSHQVGSYLNKPRYQNILQKEPLQVIGYKEPSIIFEIGTHKVHLNQSTTVNLPKDPQQSALILVSKNDMPALEAQLKSDGSLRVERLKTFTGIDLNHGKKVSLTLFLVRRKESR